jgi:hypothetical protein
MSTIREVVGQNVQAQYLPYGNQAIAALERREAQAVETIRQAARAEGLNGTRVEAVLQRAGLVQPPAPAADTTNQRLIADLQRQVRDLTRRVEDAARTTLRR